MNILYYSTKKRWRGIVSWMKRTALGLEAKGHSVFILSHPACKIANDKELKVIPFKAGFDYNPITILRLVIFIKRNRIDLIVTNIKREVNQGGIAAKICRIPNIRRIGTEMDFDHSRMKKKLKYITHVISPCNYMIEQSRKKHPHLMNLKMSCVYNGREPLEISEIEKTSIRKRFAEPGDIIIGMNCQISKSKNIPGAIRVFANIGKCYPHLKMVIVGEGPEFNSVKEYIRSLDLQNRVIMTDFSYEAYKYCSVYDISILFSNLEGFSNSVVEYMAAGSAVICTDVGGQSEIVKDNYNGFLVPSNNENALSKKLKILITNEKLRKRFGENALKTIKTYFSEKDMLNSLEIIYQKAIT